MLTFPYRLSITLFSEDGAVLGTVSAECDWEPLQEWTRLHFQRRGLLSTRVEDESASVLPLWAAASGEPLCRGLRLRIEQPGWPPVASDFPNTLFKDRAGALASLLVEQNKLRAGDAYSYVLAAYPAAETPDPGRLLVRDTSPCLPVQDGSIEEFLVRANPCGVLDADDIPVFVASRVLEEAAAQTREQQGNETGGILIGRLWRDTRAAEIFVEVSAQIPAVCAAGTSVKLTFTPETWTAAAAALHAHGHGEIFLGYWHSHPVREWCTGKSCTPEAQKTCVYARDFFSADDIAVMRAAFPRAWCVAIVANDTALGLSFSMFGNRRGATQPRGFYVMEDTSNVA